MLTDDRGARICREGELANLYVVSIFASLRLGEADAADFGMAIGSTRDVFGIDRLARLACDLRDRDDRLHGADVGELRRAQHNVTDGIDARLGGLHPGICLDEAAVGLDLRALETHVFRAW